MKIIIITDGNNLQGLGHVYQSITLAGYLSERVEFNPQIFFITKSDKHVIKLIKNAGFDVLTKSSDEEIFKVLVFENPDRIIFDKIDVSPKLAKRIKNELEAKLIIFTNLTDANLYADVSILADIGSNFKNIYKKDKANGKVEFFGPKYWILRPEFYKNKIKKVADKKGITKIMLIFGGSDPSNMSTLVLKELLKMHVNLDILLVLGSAFAHTEQLNIVLNENLNSLSKVKIVKNVNNVAELMHQTDLVLASPGLSFFESLAIGTPVIGFHQDEIQKKTYKDLLPTIDKNEIAKLPEMIKDMSFIFPNDPFITSMDIGRGKDQIIQEILN